MKNTMWLLATAFLYACSPTLDSSSKITTLSIDAASDKAASLNELLSSQTVISLDRG